MSTRGTDESDKPVGVEHYTSAKIAEDLAAIIDHFGEEKAIIIGQDSGGLHAWHFAMTLSRANGPADLTRVGAPSRADPGADQ